MPNLWNITAYPSYCEGAQNTYNKSMVVQNHLTQSLFYNKVQVSHRMKTALKNVSIGNFYMSSFIITTLETACDHQSK